MILLDDHLVRDWIARELPADLDGELATTNLWLFRLAGALVNHGLQGALSSPVGRLSPRDQRRFRSAVRDRVAELTIVPMRQIVWSMADLRETHRNGGRHLSAAMVEALAAAHSLGADIAVAAEDVGPGLRAAARADGIGFRIVTR